MTRFRFRAAALAGAAAIALLSPGPARAQWLVYDPTNYAQNVLQAARSLQQITNQVTSLQNEAQMLFNQARNLASLPQSSLAQLQQTVSRTQALLGQAQRLAYDVQNIEAQFGTLYARDGFASLTDRQLVEGARERWRNSVSAFEDSLKVQAEVVRNLDTTRTEMGSLVSASQGATGALQAAQAGNQLLALQSQQLVDLTAVLAAQGRAQSLEAARTAAAEEQAREQRRRFLGAGTSGYQAQAVRMFHD